MSCDRNGEGKVDFYRVKAVNEPHLDEIEQAALRVIRSGRYILGDECAQFERAFAAYVGTKHAVAVGNGLAALRLIIRAYGFAQQDEIIIPGNTFIATVLAATLNGCTPVLVEPDERTFNIDPIRTEQAITPKTKAILCVHLYGQLAPMGELRAVADRHGLILIEDCAQACGAVLGGRRAGSLSHAAGFSFYPTKPLGGFGDAGAVTTDDAAIAAKIRTLRNYGSGEPYVFDEQGINSRMDEIQAAMLRVKLGHLDAENARRRQLADLYRAKINHPKILLPKASTASEAHVWHLFVVRCAERDRLIRHLARHDIPTAIHYPIPPHRQKALKFLGALFLPITEALSREVLSLPLDPSLTEEQITAIADCVNQFH